MTSPMMVFLACAAMFAPYSKLQPLPPATEKESSPAIADSTAVTIVLVDRRIPPTIMRRITQTPRDLVLVDVHNVQPAAVANAVSWLVRLNEIDVSGESRSDREMVRVPEQSEGLRLVVSPASLSRVPKDATISHVDGIGLHPSFLVEVERPRGHGRVLRRTVRTTGAHGSGIDRLMPLSRN